MEGKILEYIYIFIDFSSSEYQGDVSHGRRHGTGVFRHGQSSLIYEGEWNKGNIHGKVC